MFPANVWFFYFVLLFFCRYNDNAMLFSIITVRYIIKRDFSSLLFYLYSFSSNMVRIAGSIVRFLLRYLRFIYQNREKSSFLLLHFYFYLILFSLLFNKKRNFSRSINFQAVFFIYCILYILIFPFRKIFELYVLSKKFKRSVYRENM